MQKKINQMEFKSKLSNKIIGGKKSEKQENEIRKYNEFLWCTRQDHQIL